MAENVVKSICMDAGEVERALTRIAHQILEKNKGAANIALVGIVTRGDLLAKRLAAKIEEIEGVHVPFGRLDISFYRDDFATHFSPEVLSTEIDFDIDGMDVILVDDILYTGRTIRAALDALMDIGRPARIQLAVLVDRNTAVGTLKEEHGEVGFDECDAVGHVQRGGNLARGLHHIRPAIDADNAHIPEPQRLGQVKVERKGQVGLAAAAIHHRERLFASLFAR